MRTLLLVLLAALAAAADLEYRRVTVGAEEVTGWWDSATRVMYLPDGKHRWLKKPDKVEVMPSPPGEKAPAKRAFTKLPDLPYCRVKRESTIYIGWFHAASGMLFPDAPNDPFPMSFGPNSGVTIVAQAPSPRPMPESARDHLDHWAIEHAAEIDAAAHQSP